ncbi:phosphatidate cytidylyltransferase [Actinoplanes awajinensis]|uniref:Phosphatidate cytidylyltransferase n=1 Tax=Actinoplanes awajinensis subsp. mycoplanecinus TaxID=135947 RepID=A0A101JKY1_9ACTN|nr:phosphatidate cytidylyltransferase [Actinoplanes awajinensis]KUL28639.1 phosphatidate cytidylyltransferase [Actinoplanes awajinensis subsp. mycoplanecinus]
MSYLDPRAGQASGDDTSVPASYAHRTPATPEDPYAEHRRSPAAQAYPDPVRHVDERPAPMTAPDGPLEPPAGKRVKGRRRAGRGQGEQGKSRAGRNLPAAIAVGLSLGLVVLASLLVWPPALLGVVVVAAAVGVWETARALTVTGARPPLVPLIAGTVVMTGLAWYEGTDALTLGLVATIGAAALWRLADGVQAVRRDFTAITLIAVYVPFLLSFAAMLVRPEDDGQWRVLATVVAVVLSDTGGYAAGVFFGKTPMAPKISPKKSWEGFAGSVTAAAIGSGALLFFLMEVPVYYGLLFGAVISVVAVLGDLFESMLKRDLRVKDMSNLLPGHGGLMDRLDSILFAVPTAYLLFAIIAPN